MLIDMRDKMRKFMLENVNFVDKHNNIKQVYFREKMFQVFFW